MSSIWGKRIRLCIFGESHGEEIGVTVDGFPHGMRVDLDLIEGQLERRKPLDGGTKRRESDKFRIISGVYRGFTTGSPITALFKNENAREYPHGGVCRPSQSDFTASVKYAGFNDDRSGGHFSARLTAPFVFAGGLAMQYLSETGVEIGAHILNVHNILDGAFDECGVTADLLRELRKRRTINPGAYEAILKEVKRVGGEGDSLGGIIECAAVGVKAGAGEPLFNSIESDVAALLFSIPSVKGVEFGGGFSLAGLKGSEANDNFFLAKGGERYSSAERGERYSSAERDERGRGDYGFDSKTVKTLTNKSGGVQGGLTNGMPVIVRAAFKPVPSIRLVQTAYDCREHKTVPLSADNPNDVCAVLRAAPIVESAVALALLDNML